MIEAYVWTKQINPEQLGPTDVLFWIYSSLQDVKK